MVYEEQNKTLIDSLNSILNLDMVHKLNAINESRLEMIEKFTKSEEIIHRKVEKMYTLVLDLHREALAKETQTMRLFDSVNTSLTSYNSALESRSDTLSVFTKELRSISESLNSFKDDISLSLKLQRSISGSIDRFVELSRDFDRRFSSNVDYTMKSIDSEVADIVKKLALLAHSIANEGRVIQDSLNQYFKEENRKK
jgi:Mg2+ and Co2+ transporter CorA